MGIGSWVVTSNHDPGVDVSGNQTTGGGDTAALQVPLEEADRFRAIFGTAEYERNERGYKVALHAVISRLLGSESLGSSEFPSILRATLENDIQYGELGFDQAEWVRVDQRFTEAQLQGVRGALANISGGRWGLTQFTWIPRAIDQGLGEDVATAFRGLISGEDGLSSRVDRFRDELYDVQRALRDKGGFEPNWQLLRVSLSFVAAILGAYDPSRYTFYAAKPLQHAVELFRRDWPRGTAGERYEQLCRFVGEVFEGLRQAEIPVRDLIDAQSFLWLIRETEERPPTETAGGVAIQARPDERVIAAELARELFWDLPRSKSLVQLAERSRQLLFQGPPGTGKTFVARILGRLLSGDEEGRVQIIQFHPSYSYEDFVEGIRPRLTEGSEVGFELRPGILLRMVERAIEFPEERFFLIIDEINRGNLPRIFGELLFALEYRGPENRFMLPYSGVETYLPENLWLIGTMNTADRSIALVDAAVRRRFKHVMFPPDLLALRRWLQDRGLGDLVDPAVSGLTALNARLLELLDQDRLIGHSFLMREDLRRVGRAIVWEEDLAPVLREHLFNQPEAVEDLREVFLGQ
jgi:hypothetical protein